MATTRSLTCSYPATPSRVASLLKDPDFLRRRCDDAGETNVRVVVRELDGGFYASLERDKSFELPSFARRFLQPKNRIVDEYDWRLEGESWHATYTLVIAGVPAQIRGHSALKPSADGTRHETTFEVLVRVPLVAAKLESIVADRLEQTFFEQAARNTKQLV